MSMFYVKLPSKRKAALVAKITRQGKLGPLITKCGLKAHCDNLAIGLKSGAASSSIQVAKRRPDFAPDAKGSIK